MMTNAVFSADDLREDVELEAKRAAGRDGKGALPQDMWETYSAFANTNGGVILLGVKEKKSLELEAVGIVEPERVTDELWSTLHNPNKVSRNLLTPESVALLPTGNGRWVIKIDVPRAPRQDRPVFINGNPLTGTYKRLRAGDYHCTETEVKRMLAEQTEDARDARILRNYTFSDIDMDSFQAYRARLASLKPDHPYNNDENLDFLRKVGGWREDRDTGEQGLTLAGLLMFGKGHVIQEAVRHYFVDYREVPSSEAKTTWTDRLVPDGTWSGNLFDFYRSVIQRLFRDLKVPFRLEGDEREDDTLVHKALREALVNAIVHADYSASLSILVVKAPDYFGFRNPGQMRIPIEMALEGGHSDCRNRSLQKMFSLIGLGEQAGSGIPRVIENWKAQLYRIPRLWETEDPEATLMKLQTISLLPEETLVELRDRFGASFDTLGDDGRLALATAQIEGFVTNARLQQISSRHPRDITSLLKRLVEGELLVPNGRGPATTYRIAGTDAVDLAGSMDFSNPPLSSTHKESISTHKGGSSTHLSVSPTHLDVSPTHLSDSSTHLEAENVILDAPCANPLLLKIAEPVRSKGKTSKEITQQCILELCEGRFLSIAQLSDLLNRSPEGIRERFVKPMIVNGILERRFPNQPSHVQQAYRKRKDSNE